MRWYQVTAAPCVDQGLTDAERLARTTLIEMTDVNPWMQYRTFTTNSGRGLMWFGGDRWEQDGVEYEFFIEVIIL